MTREEAVWYANHVFNLVIERCINAQNLEDAREFDEAKQIVIEALEQEPKRGHWLDNDNSFYANCSECGYQMDTHEERGYHNFCPNCGSRMENDEE